MGLADDPSSPSAIATAANATVPSPATSADLPADVAWAFGLAVPDGSDVVTITRAEAMRVPAVKRGRLVIAGTIGTLPLVASRAGGRGGAGPAGDDDTVELPLLDQPDPNLTRSALITWTVDDLIFNGVSWWRVTARNAARWPVAVERVTRDRVTITTEGSPPRPRVRIDGHLVDDADVIRFDGPDEGVLATSAGELHTCLRLAAAVRNFARLDVPLGSIEPVEGSRELSTEPGSAATTTDPERSEVDAMLDGWEKARAQRSTAYLRNAKYVTHQLDARQLQLAEARQHQVAEVARILNLPPRFVAAASGDSLTYATSESERLDLVDFSLAHYMAPIADRLSLGDVTPRGTVVRFELSQFLRGDLATVGGLLDRRVVDVPEARQLVGLRPRTDLPAAPSPAAGGTPDREDTAP
jgi:hypothetical protein